MWKIDADGQMSQRGSLGIQQLLVDRIIEREIVLLDRIPELRAVLLAQEHDCLPSTGTQVVGFFNAVPEEIMHHLVLHIEPDELFCRVS